MLHNSRMTNASTLSQKLTKWYLQTRRPLPWRSNKDPYRIWLSEIMLQQTTVQAVIPYYEKFLLHFPDVHVLANTPIDKIMSLWSGLGYYSRARNLHKAAQHFSKNGFAKNHVELLEIPGLGPYTARAIASIAFNEPVGVVDGNVIRVLSRLDGKGYEHWKSSEKNKLQERADALARAGESSIINQALMELGATVCARHQPLCNICPWNKNCIALKENKVSALPISKKRREQELWLWQPEIYLRSTRIKGQKKNMLLLIENDVMPFLKKQKIFPGKASQIKKKPESFDLKHGITHHTIYVQIKSGKPKEFKNKKSVWCELEKVSSLNPSNLLQKILQRVC